MNETWVYCAMIFFIFFYTEKIETHPPLFLQLCIDGCNHGIPLLAGLQKQLAVLVLAPHLLQPLSLLLLGLLARGQGGVHPRYVGFHPLRGLDNLSLHLTHHLLFVQDGQLVLVLQVRRKRERER